MGMHEQYALHLLDALEEYASGPYKRTVWRITFEGQEPTRPNVRGARWNPKDVSALYTSLTIECARAEFGHLLELQPRRPSLAANEYQIEVRLTNVIDLSAPDRLAQLDIEPSAQ